MRTISSSLDLQTGSEALTRTGPFALSSRRVNIGQNLDVRYWLPAQPVDATLDPRWKDEVCSVISEESRLSVSSQALLNKAVRQLNERPRKVFAVRAPETN
jgi:hypothetical protein